VYFFDLEEVDEENAKMRIIAQIFSEDVKKWFHSLAVGSINSSQQLT